MTQRVPEFSFSEEAIAVRAFLYEFWCEHGRGPNLRAVAEATGLDRQFVLRAYRELELGTICVVDHDSQNGNLLKLQPFSSYPSQVEVWIDGRFHSYAGCALESIAISGMPPFRGKTLRLESYCACCLDPVRVETRDLTIASSPPDLRVHISASPRDWNKTNIVSMCDSMNFVHGEDHAARYERQVARRGVLLTLDQASRFVADTAKNRMWNRDWPPVTVDPERILKGLEALGVDLSPWGR